MLTRRRLFKLGFLANLSSMFVFSSARARAAPATDVGSGFRALVDTLVPADAFPGAIDLGIDRMLFSRVRKNANYLKVMTETVAGLDALAAARYNAAFATLPLAQRTDIVSAVLASKQRFPEGNRQISALRMQVISAFYASETAFNMLDYHPPSQGGYPDYAQAPEIVLKD